LRQLSNLAFPNDYLTAERCGVVLPVTKPGGKAMQTNQIGVYQPVAYPLVKAEAIEKASGQEENRDKSRARKPSKTIGQIVWAMVPVWAIGMISLSPNAAAQADSYPNRAPVEQYLMEENAEIQLARSAAPDSISHDATILVLRREGYATAVKGRNGFVCMVARGWAGMFDWPEFWSPKVKAADCLNPQAARSIVPILSLRARLAMAGRSKAEMIAAVKAAYEKKQLPELESGAMDYMMSKSSYLTDQGGHNVPHVMFYRRVDSAKDWGSGEAGSPIMATPYWFFSQKEHSQSHGLPPIFVSLVMVPEWSDGTPAGEHHD
jgi:hypothetical protein